MSSCLWFVSVSLFQKIILLTTFFVTLLRRTFAASGSGEDLIAEISYTTTFLGHFSNAVKARNSLKIGLKHLNRKFPVIAEYQNNRYIII